MSYVIYSRRQNIYATKIPNVESFQWKTGLIEFLEFNSDEI